MIGYQLPRHDKCRTTEPVLVTFLSHTPHTPYCIPLIPHQKLYHVSLHHTFALTMLQQPKFVVSAPFDGSHNADIILRSSDNVNFRVLKDILALASPIFHDMMTLARPLVGEPKATSEDVYEDGLPVVTMHDSNALVLDALLRILYPVRTPVLEDLGVVTGVVEAARKYDMDSVMAVAEEALQRAAIAQGGVQALQVYMIAYTHDLQRTACNAALEFLRCPSAQCFSPEMERMPAGVLFRLFEYRRQVAERVDSLFAPISGWKLSDSMRCVIRDIECPLKRSMKPSEGCGATENGHDVSAWWAALREEVRCEVQKAPLSESVMNVGVVSRAVCASKCCSACQLHVVRALPMLVDTIRHEMERLAAEVC